VSVQDASYASALPKTSASDITISDHEDCKAINALRSTTGTDSGQLAGLNVTSVPIFLDAARGSVKYGMRKCSQVRPTKVFRRLKNRQRRKFCELVENLEK